MSKRIECQVCRTMASYSRLTSMPQWERFYSEDSECLGHFDGTMDALKGLLANEPSKHFLTRDPLNSAEEYAQAVGWAVLGCAPKPKPEPEPCILGVGDEVWD